MLDWRTIGDLYYSGMLGAYLQLVIEDAAKEYLYDYVHYRYKHLMSGTDALSDIFFDAMENIKKRRASLGPTEMAREMFRIILDRNMIEILFGEELDDYIKQLYPEAYEELRHIY